MIEGVAVSPELNESIRLGQVEAAANEEARLLYFQIARAYYWSHDEFCGECGCVLEGGSCPEGCGAGEQ